MSSMVPGIDGLRHLPGPGAVEVSLSSVACTWRAWSIVDFTVVMGSSLLSLEWRSLPVVQSAALSCDGFLVICGTT
jgi:uncharacterized membrane protein (DUF2068 family)